MWNVFVKPGPQIAFPIFSAGVAAKTKNPQVGEVTSNILKLLTGAKNLSSTDMHGRCLRLKSL